MYVQNFTKLSAAVHELSTVHQISDNSGFRSRISLERIKQSTNGKRRYHEWTFDEEQVLSSSVLHQTHLFRDFLSLCPVQHHSHDSLRRCML